MKIEIEMRNEEELENTKHALRCAIIYTNSRLKDGVGGAHAERRPACWWDNFTEDVKIAKTLRSLLDKLGEDADTP